MVREFFFGCADGSTKKAFESTNIENVMISYATKNKTAPKTTKKLFVDSGAFSFFFYKNGYNTSHREYLSFVEKKNAYLFANRDFPCEPQLLKKYKTTVKENQKRTINNQIELMDLIDDEFPHLKDKFVAVIQGWQIEEYLYMLDKMKEQGLLTRRIGIGSICRRGQDNEIRKIIFEIRANLPKKYELHAFGVKFSVLKFKDVWDALTSVDSSAFRFLITNNGTPIWLQIKEKVETWIKKIEKLKEKHEKQKLLFPKQPATFQSGEKIGGVRFAWVGSRKTQCPSDYDEMVGYPKQAPSMAGGEYES